MKKVIGNTFTLAITVMCLLLAVPSFALTPTEVAKLLQSDVGPGDEIGISVAIDGDTAVIGAPGPDTSLDPGSAYVFTRTDTMWTEQAKLTASDGEQYDHFGESVAITGDTIVIGAPGSTGSGSAYVFTRTDTTWTEQAKVTPSDAAGFDGFGASVAISGNTALIGANVNDHAGAGSGSAYVFTRTDTTWTEQAKLAASDADGADSFGVSVALSDNTAGYYNSASGVNALQSNTAGYYNTASGVSALESNTAGYFNTASGVSALTSNTAGYYNSASGVSALQSNTAGYFNSASGSGS